MRARDLVRRILTFSRSMSQVAAPLDLNSIIANTEIFLRDTLPRMIELQTELGADIGLVKGDKTQIDQVLINLATNARDAMPEGGRLLIKTAKVKVGNQVCLTCGDNFSGEYIRLRVKDSGSGMDRKTLRKAFDPFFTTKSVGKGTGLGLSMIFGIVQGHKGHIAIDSAPGTGTHDRHIPASPVKEGAQKENRTLVENDMAGGCEAILLVDDEPALLDIGRKVLTGAGYKAHSASTGEEALDLYRRLGRKIDMVVLDLSMPGMGGHKCLRELRALDPELKIVVSTGYSRDGDLGDTISSGAAALLPKPFNRSEMLEIVRKVLDA